MGLDPVLAWVARIGLSLLFSVAVWHKVRSLRSFTSTLTDYRILPGVLNRGAAPVLVALEAGLVIALLVPAADPIGPVAALGLLLLYGFAIAINLLRGRHHIDCGCLGPAHRQTLTSWLLARNALLALAPVALLLPGVARPLSWIDGVTVFGGVVMLVLIWNAAHELRATTPALRVSGSPS